MSSFIVRRMAFFNSPSAKSGWYHIMIPTTFRCSSFRDQVVCPLPAYPVSTHTPDFVAIFVHIRGILAVIPSLVWYPEYRPHRRAAALWSAAVWEAQAPAAAFRPQASALPARGQERRQVPRLALPAAFPYFSCLPLSQHPLSGQLRRALVLGRVVPPLCLAAATQRHTGPSKR